MPRDTVTPEYHALLARHEAMRLRRQLLTPAQSPAARTAREPEPSYDGAADQRVIAQSLELIASLDDLISRLYDALFGHWPYLRSLFPASMDFQKRHLVQIFRYLIGRLHRPDDVAAEFTRLGRDHRKLGVRPAHYLAFEAALREALRGTAGAQWTGTMEEAWLRMLRFAVAAMNRGAEEALREPPSWHATVTRHELRGPGLAVLRVSPHEPYAHRAGQFAAVASPLLPQAWRQYSLACAPRTDGELEFHVRQAGPGGVSEALVARTRAGDTLRLGPASGTATLDAAPARDLLLVADDTGWAPAKALLEELAARRSGHRMVHLFLGARHASERYDAAAVAALAQRLPWLRVVEVATGEEALAEAVARQGDWSGHLAFVSGPPDSVGSVVTRLTALGLPAGQIRHDPLPGLPALTGRRAEALEGADT
ncbi:globin domain-containing protein [Streptomyces morookaense]|uniref:globin domain-containing protein n=1 Tax=Streptomyces morookaense TaxID=1970 RepID=UPI0019856D38|nr:globin domain-containing protein [Streptomyces morookaense]GHF47133.1 oxidoreductase [Streptomyces morookaense]